MIHRTPLYEKHKEADAKLVEFAGWELPLMYTSITEEHNWTREKIGLFDVSHMGRFEISGPESAETLDTLCTNAIIDLENNSTKYTLMCNEAGGILDDMMVTRFGEEKFYLVCNASNREKILKWIEKQALPGTNIVDKTFETGMMAIQGPLSAKLAKRYLPEELSSLAHRKAYIGEIFGIEIIAFRGGYTGEDGFEIVLPAEVTPMVWDQLINVRFDNDKIVKPAGLGARNTLRIEAGLPLYGHELTEQIDPISAKLEFAVNFEHDFIGKESMQKIKEAGPSKVRVGLILNTRRSAREGFKIYKDDEECGYITSGTFSITLQKSIAMGYVKREFSEVGENLLVEIGKEYHKAEVVKLPFYKRKK